MALRTRPWLPDRISPSGSASSTPRRAPGVTGRSGARMSWRSPRARRSTRRQCPSTRPTRSRAELRAGPADWYAVTVKGARAPGRPRPAPKRRRRPGRGGLLRSVSAGFMPAGSVIFPDDAATVVALEAAGKAAGVFFELGLGATPRRRSSTRRRESPSSSTVEAPSSQTRPGRCARSLAPTWASSRPRAGELPPECPDGPAGELRRHLQHRSDLPDRQHGTDPSAGVLRGAAAGTSRRASPRPTSPS